MAQSFKAAFLALLISQVTSLSPILRPVHGEALVSPTCTPLSKPLTALAYNIPSWCICAATNNGGAYPGAYPTTSPAGINAPSGDQLCSYTTVPSTTNAITPTPVTCNLASATSGFTVPHSWCDCTAETDTATYSTLISATGINAACPFMQEEFPAGTISPSPATCVPVTVMSGFCSFF